MRYPSGNYISVYEGESPYYKFDALPVARQPGRDVLVANPSPTGIYVESDKPFNLLSVVEERYEDLLRSGEIFHPLFIEKIRGFKVLRFMCWMNVSQPPPGCTQGSWGKRPLVNDAFWSTEKGVPLEVMIELCNRVGAAPWFNMPHLATKDYATRFAAMVKKRLIPELPVYFELSNETWNYSSYYITQTKYFEALGRKLWPDSTDPDWAVGFRAYAYRANELASIWKRAFGKRLTAVINAQAANIGVADMMLKGLPANTAINAIAIAPYFGDKVNTMDKDQFFAEVVPKSIETAMQWVKNYKTLADSEGMRLVVYEGGQGFYSDDNFTAEVNRDPRMGLATEDYLSQYYTINNDTFCYFGDITRYSTGLSGAWGAWESVYQKTSPKGEAVKKFPLGVVLSGIANWMPNAPFLNLRHHAEGYIWHRTKWGDGIPKVDAQGWPITVDAGEKIGLLMNREFPDV